MTTDEAVDLMEAEGTLSTIRFHLRAVARLQGLFDRGEASTYDDACDLQGHRRSLENARKALPRPRLAWAQELDQIDHPKPLRSRRDGSIRLRH